MRRLIAYTQRVKLGQLPEQENRERSKETHPALPPGGGVAGLGILDYYRRYRIRSFSKSEILSVGTRISSASIALQRLIPENSRDVFM